VERADEQWRADPVARFGRADCRKHLSQTGRHRACDRTGSRARRRLWTGGDRRHFSTANCLALAGPPDRAPRHQTLSATLDWSYNLLSDVERTVLRRLSVFVAGFTLEVRAACRRRSGNRKGGSLRRCRWSVGEIAGIGRHVGFGYPLPPARHHADLRCDEIDRRRRGGHLAAASRRILSGIAAEGAEQCGFAGGRAAPPWPRISATSGPR